MEMSSVVIFIPDVIFIPNITMYIFDKRDGGESMGIYADQMVLPPKVVASCDPQVAADVQEGVHGSQKTGTKF
jgi:hypothetical protein